MNMINKNTQALAHALSYTGNDERMAAYSGSVVALLGYSSTDKEGKHRTRGDLKVVIRNYTYELNEITVLDKDAYAAIGTKFIKFKERPIDPKAGFISSFDDVLGISNIFGKALVDAINKHPLIYSKALVATKTCINLGESVLEESDSVYE